MKKPGVILKSFFLLLLICSCRENKVSEIQTKSEFIEPILYARGFEIQEFESYTLLTVSQPWPNSNRTYTYLLLAKKNKVPQGLHYDELIRTPVERIVVTATAHIPILEALDEEKSLVGFPSLSFISSPRTRKRIDENKITELGSNELLNIEKLLALKPEVVIGFGIEGQNKAYSTLSRAGIPVVYQGDWVEQSPLGKAEWIKFMAAFFEKKDLADTVFSKIKKRYLSARQLASQVSKKPTVMSGALYKDVWYSPGGQSWASKLFKDAGALYVWRNTKATGSLSLNIENVILEAQNTDFWVGPAQFTSFKQLKEANGHYGRFKAFENKNVYSYSLKKGETGGLLYFEMGPHRPDWILEDLIHIFHPNLLPSHTSHFYEALQ